MEKLCWEVEIAVAKLLLQLWPAPPCGGLPEYTKWGVVSWQVALVQPMTAVVTFAQPTILLHFCSHDLIVNHCRGMYLVAIQPASCHNVWIYFVHTITWCEMYFQLIWECQTSYP